MHCSYVWKKVNTKIECKERSSFADFEIFVGICIHNVDNNKKLFLQNLILFKCFEIPKMRRRKQLLIKMYDTF